MRPRFLSTLSLRRATFTSVVSSAGTIDFYPRSPCGERRDARHRTYQINAFLSTLSLRRATPSRPWGPDPSTISIHALLAESDQLYDTYAKVLRVFLSTLSLRRATRSWTHWPTTRHLFLSTLSLRRATPVNIQCPAAKNNFYPRSPCGERPLILTDTMLHTEFLSTLSLRRATVGQKRFLQKLAISIHALLAESDGTISQLQCVLGDFYPRSPCGERQRAENHANSQQEFLSTLSLRRATYAYCIIDKVFPISIHALLAESDLWVLMGGLSCDNFYPRSPCGERLFNPLKAFIILTFLSTLSLRRATSGRLLTMYTPNIFLSTLSLRRATVRARAVEGQRPISIHALLAESDIGAAHVVAYVQLFLSTLSLRRATPGRALLSRVIGISIHALLAESD